MKARSRGQAALDQLVVAAGTCCLDETDEVLEEEMVQDLAFHVSEVLVKGRLEFGDALDKLPRQVVLSEPGVLRHSIESAGRFA